MCKSQEGTQLSTAGRWFCQPCTDWLPPTGEEDEKDARIEELQKALEVVRDTLAHKKNEDRTSWALWDIANIALKGDEHK